MAEVAKPHWTKSDLVPRLVGAGVAIPLIPADADPRIAAYISGIGGAIKAFLAVLGPAQSTLTASPKLGGAVVKPSWAERRQLNAIQNRAEAVAAKIAAR